MPEFIGGFQRAVQDVNTLKSSNYTNALGQFGFGQRGEHYRVLFLNESSTVTIPIGQIVFLETATAALTAAGQTATGFQPWIVQTAANTNLGAGLAIATARGQGLVICQVGGPATVTLSASSDAVGPGTAIFVPSNTGLWTTIAGSTSIPATDSSAIAPILGMFGRMNPGYSAGQSTVVINIVPADVFKVI